MMSSRSRLYILISIGSLLVTSGCRPSEPISTATEPPQEMRVAAPDANWVRLIPPIDCTLGEDCFTLLYVDRDPSPNEIDFGCGRQTYDGHKGTDFAIPDEAVMEQGVNVLAAADGTVLRLRDGEIDRRRTTAEEIAEVEESGKECGNGMVVDHGNGWETQYCHLKQGSVAVVEGQSVRQGDVLGEVGLSGKTTFPHVHITVRYQGEVVDPFVGATSALGCNVTRRPLWQEPLDYEPTGILRSGFAAEQITIDRLWDGAYRDSALSRDIPLIFFWVHGYGILEGDVEHFLLLDPRGNVITDYEQTAEASQKNWANGVGKRNTSERPILPGTWRGEYKLIRNGEVVAELEREIEVR
ncbi:MAG: M23 family metallopeptidase [Cyanobacteria bacterium SID2]|nr:M23 family metallopeptidase [Cyanobacteria bacterium SID2]MBP0003211.1 M23 family metallopeptidase [Cyanobacteria bacterium SBC]